jgi:hypothetical protein
LQNIELHFTTIAVYIEVVIDAGGALRLLINFDLGKHVFADTGGPSYATNALLSAF